MRLVFLGAAGSGKGLRPACSTSGLGWRYIGTGDILRDAVRRKTPLGQQVVAYLHSGQAGARRLVNDLIAELFRRPDRADEIRHGRISAGHCPGSAFEAVLKDAGLDLRQCASCSTCRRTSWLRRPWRAAIDGMPN